jgi:hypothetical protein
VAKLKQLENNEDNAEEEEIETLKDCAVEWILDAESQKWSNRIIWYNYIVSFPAP